jgi:hypothetical protein
LSPAPLLSPLSPLSISLPPPPSSTTAAAAAQSSKLYCHNLQKVFFFLLYVVFQQALLSLACISYHPPTPNQPTPPPSPPPLFDLNIANFVVAIVFIFLKGIPEKIKSLAYNNYFCHVISFQAIKKEGRHY